MVSNATKEAINLPEDKKDGVLHSIEVLLMTVNINETLATQGYLKKLDGHAHVYKFLKHIDLGQQTAKYVTFYIGKYGSCPAAVGVVPNDFEVHSSENNLTALAYDCFPNVSTIVSTGIACGIQKKVKICDVLVSSKVVYADHESTERKTLDITNQLMQLFNQPVGWPHKSIQERLEYNQIMQPNVMFGVVLSGLHHTDNPALKSKNIESDVVGTDMEGAHLFTGAVQNMANIIIVKAVCDLEDGRHSETYQPTAAFLAADLVYKCLRTFKARNLFKGLFILMSD